jgi:hypothetical protein
MMMVVERRSSYVRIIVLPDKLAAAIELIAEHLKIHTPVIARKKESESGGLPKSIAEQYSRMVAILLMHGLKDQAHNAIDRAFEAAGRGVVTTDTQVNDLFSNKVANNLAAEGIITIGDLVATTEERLMGVTNVSGRTVRVIREMLVKHGFRLATDQQDS